MNENTDTKKYNVIRRHSSDNGPSIVESFDTKAECNAYIKNAISILKTTHMPNKVSKLGNVTNIRFISFVDSLPSYSIGYWIDKSPQAPVTATGA
jgi:hypothetical protein